MVFERDEVLRRLTPEFEARRGTLEWYCLDFWAETLDLDLQGLKHNVSHEIRFLARRAEISHAHQRTWANGWFWSPTLMSGILRLKLARTGLDSYFDAIYSSHDFGVPKEVADFWGRLNAVEPFDIRSSLFADDSLPVLQFRTRLRDTSCDWDSQTRQRAAACASWPISMPLTRWSI